MSTHAEVRRNQRVLVVLVALPGLVPAVFGLLVGLLIGSVLWVLAGVVVGVALSALVWLASDSIVLGRTGGAIIEPDDEPRLANVVEGLCVNGGVARPHLAVVEDPGIDACSIGRNPSGATLVVTRGMLDVLDRVELEAIVAHELAHLRSHDVSVATVASVVIGSVGIDPASVLGVGRELTADLHAVELTRYPTALASALEKAAGAPRDSGRAARSVGHLWISGSQVAAVSGERTITLPARIAVLREL